MFNNQLKKERESPDLLCLLISLVQRLLPRPLGISSTRWVRWANVAAPSGLPPPSCPRPPLLPPPPDRWRGEGQQPLWNKGWRLVWTHDYIIFAKPPGWAQCHMWNIEMSPLEWSRRGAGLLVTFKQCLGEACSCRKVGVEKSVSLGRESLWASIQYI